MAKLEQVSIELIGVEDMRRLSAALEQYNAGSRGDAAQINRLEVHLTEARDELAYAFNIIKNRNMRQLGASYKTELLSAIADLVDRDVRREIVAAELAKAHDRIHQLDQVLDQQVAALKKARADVDDQGNEVNGERARRVELENKVRRLEADLRKEQKIKVFVNDECQKIRAALGLTPLAQAPEVLAAIDALQVDRSMQAHTVGVLRGRVNDLQEQVAKAAPVEYDKKLAGALKMCLAEANDQIAKMADVIKHMHEEYHQLQARKQGAEFDLERAKEEIAFAEAETAKYKPLIEAVRGGFVYGFRGKWVRVNSATVAQLEDCLAVSFLIPNSEDPQCL